MNKTIGWIGTGLMGLPMAGHLQAAGYPLNVFNRTKEKAQKLLDGGAIWCDSIKNLTQNSDIVFTIIGYPKDVEEVYFGVDGIMAGLKPGQILVDMTTTKPSLAVEIAEKANAKNAFFLDAPVSGGELGAINGKLSVMMGGDEAALETILPIIDYFSANVVYQGKAGSGQHTKMCNQITIAGTMIGVCESLIYGKKAGLDLHTMLSSISKGAAGCWTLDVLAPKVADQDFAPGFMVEHFVKDMGIALEEAAKMQLSLPGLALAKQLYQSVQALGKGREGTQALYLALEKMSGL